MPTEVSAAAGSTASLLLARLLGGVGKFFEPTPRAGASTDWEKWVLAAILISGAFLRFWGLGEIGLHREDEDTTSLPAIHILEDGVPRYPSGMAYGRAILQSYMIAGSVAVFGKTEWALRFPSAVCGVLLIYLAYLLGRRFLSPVWNLTFTATVAYLPGMILASQTARMYIFLAACLAGYAILVFAWERTGRLSRFLWALFVLIVGLQFQTLAVFASFLLFFPALLHGDTRKFWLACGGFLVILGAYRFVDWWVGLLFIEPDKLGATTGGGPTAGAMVPSPSIPLFVIALAAAVAVLWFLVRRAQSGGVRWIGVALLLAGFFAQLTQHYHMAVLLLVAGAVVAYRANRSTLPLIFVAAVVSVGIAVAQIVMLQQAGIPTLKNIFGVMIGKPSVYPYIVWTEYTIVGVMLSFAGVAFAIWEVARGRRVSDVWLMFVLWAWIPMFLIGVFIWIPAPRYTFVAVLPMLIAACATLEWATAKLRAVASTNAPAINTAIAAVACVVIVGPVAFARSVHSGYDIHPDHKGAAEYMRSLALRPNDVIVAEDAIAQRYYLDRVDYWLLGWHEAEYFSRTTDGVTRDIYTDSLIIGSADDLTKLINDPARGDIYIIGSGENQIDGRRYMRGDGLHALLTSGRFPIVYRGRDGLTTIMKIPPVQGTGTGEPE